MKKYILGILMTVYSLNSQGIEKGGFSTEIDANYYYYFVSKTTNNYFNYGFSLLLSKEISKIKISSGINYSTFYYFYNVEPTALSNYLVFERKIHFSKK